MKPPLAQGHANDFQTPHTALLPLMPYLQPNWIIWECARGKGNLEDSLKEKGFKTVGSDILTGQDFLIYKPEQFDCIITNPPFSLKQKFLERAYALEKPFAFLLPLTTFEGKARQELFKKFGWVITLGTHFDDYWCYQEYKKQRKEKVSPFIKPNKS